MEITLLACENCEKTFLAPKYLCPHCLNNKLVETKSSGTGKIYSYTKIFIAPEKFASQAPYSIILVDLEHGLRITGRLIEGEPAIDQRVELQKIERSVYWFEQIS